MWFRSRYISPDKHFSRFILLVVSFVGRMWILIFRPNLISLLLGWDGLGVTSFLLVIFYQREKSFNAGIITALTNRLGDVAILIRIGLVAQLGSWSFIYYNIFSSGHLIGGRIIIILFLASMTKRAQIPFSSWLPAAMAAPTPVSALVHSSTLVTAGVYLIVRLNHLIVETGLSLLVLILGCLTILIAGAAAVGELDIKKVIALSTLSQLGVIFFALGVGSPMVAFFHLAAHAYFKAMMFIAAGSTIHSINDYQDIRTMGEGVLLIPISVSVIRVARVRLIGLPFMRGFYSKDLILELIMMSSFNCTIFVLAIFATALTVVYSWRFLALVFLSPNQGGVGVNLFETDKWMLLGMLFLILPSIAGGLALRWACYSFDRTIFLPLWLKLFILLIIILTLISSAAVFSESSEGARKPLKSEFFQYMWFMPFIFRTTRVAGATSLTKNSLKFSEGSWILNITFGWWVRRLEGASKIVRGVTLRNFLKGAPLLLLVGLIVW